MFTIATQGFQGTNVNIGELWVTYQVTLLKPKLYASLGKYNDYFRITTYPNDELNADWGGYPLSQNLNNLTVEVANCTVYPLSTGSFVSGDGHNYGNAERPGFYISQASDDTLSIVWPVYAYAATYIIHYQVEYHASQTVASWSFSNSSSYGAASQPQTLSITTTGAVQAFHQLFAIVRVPGQKLIPYDPSLTRARTYFNTMAAGNVDSMMFTIVQINGDQPDSIHD